MNTSKKTFYTFLYKGALSGVTFVASALVGRYLDPADRVQYQYAGTFSQTGMTFVGGFTNYYGFALPRRPEDTQNIIQMGNLFIFSLSLIVWTAAVVVQLLPWHFLHLPQVVWWALMAMPFNFIFGYGSRILQGINEITWLNRANIAQPFIFLLIIGSLFFAKQNVPETLRLTLTYSGWLLSFAVTVLGTMLAAYRLLRRPNVLKWRFSRIDWRGTLNYGGWSSVAQIVNYLNYRIDFWLVGIFLPARIASLYGIAVAASEVLLNISGSVASVVFTRMTETRGSDAVFITQISTRQTLISSTIAALAMCLVFPWLLPLSFGWRYAGAVAPFFILLPGLIFKAASNIVIQYATNTLGEPKISIWMNGVSVLINAVFCVILLPAIGLLGGASASTISYVLSFVVYVIWFAKVERGQANGLWRIRKSDLVPYQKIVSQVWRKLSRR
ncbi:polysaccharide biosynthesis C-terminal domain-containing protein [Alicyclobacillus tolerans]|uniref:oligosaccharide flippase family protein n=1 Tax=Alicyclobacillus tolerans TaxID=90970 RepID=UPI001F1BB44B|nr:polysaccharide biosynthesis C-terminal domain-containing protein [Alicyclobacillus tolerans]MCF8568262.1 polysaccharide biosynthesis C-terminal domain-containing protein [Alicyclobacillus tolerans]